MKTLQIKGFVDLSLSDWEGRIASVIFLPNCNFRCPFCYNAQLVLRPESMQSVPLEEVQKYLRNSRDWVDSVVITGGEPTIHEELPLLCQEISNLGFKVKLDTNGTNSVAVENLLKQGLVDYIALDIKAPLTEEKYAQATGVCGEHIIEQVDKTMEILLEGEACYEFRTTVVPTIHQPEDIGKICERIKGCRKFVIQNFKTNVETINPELKNLKPFTQVQIQTFKDIASRIVPNTFIKE